MVTAVRSGFARRAFRRLGAETRSLRNALAPLVASKATGHPAVYYGWREGLGLDSTGRGGFVKLQRMQRDFPNSVSAGNLVYLVSSALPERANLLAAAARFRGTPLVWNQNGVAYPGWYGLGFEAVNRRMSELMRRAAFVSTRVSFVAGQRTCSSSLTEPPRFSPIRWTRPTSQRGATRPGQIPWSSSPVEPVTSVTASRVSYRPCVIWSTQATTPA